MRPVREGRSAIRLEHMVLSNSNIFLPLSNLTSAAMDLDAEHRPRPRRAGSPAPGRRHGHGHVHPTRRLVMPGRGSPRFSATETASRFCTKGSSTWSSGRRTRARWLTLAGRGSVPRDRGLGYLRARFRRGWRATCERCLMLKPGGNRLYFIRTRTTASRTTGRTRFYEVLPTRSTRRRPAPVPFRRNSAHPAGRRLARPVRPHRPAPGRGSPVADPPARPRLTRPPRQRRSATGPARQCLQPMF